MVQPLHFIRFVFYTVCMFRWLACKHRLVRKSFLHFSKISQIRYKGFGNKSVKRKWNAVPVPGNANVYDFNKMLRAAVAKILPAIARA